MGNESLGDSAETSTESSLSWMQPSEGKISLKEPKETTLKDSPDHLGKGDETEVRDRTVEIFLRDRRDQGLIPPARSETSQAAELEKEGKVVSKSTLPQSIKDLDMHRVGPTGLPTWIPRDQLPDQISREESTDLHITHCKEVIPHKVIRLPSRIRLSKDLRIEGDGILQRRPRRITTPDPDLSPLSTECPLV